MLVIETGEGTSATVDLISTNLKSSTGLFYQDGALCRVRGLSGAI